MPRPAFSPDTEQAKTQRKLRATAQRVADAELARTALILAAYEQGIPIEHIARDAGVTVKTVYRRLGHPMR